MPNSSGFAGDDLSSHTGHSCTIRPSSSLCGVAVAMGVDFPQSQHMTISSSALGALIFSMRVSVPFGHSNSSEKYLSTISGTYRFQRLCSPFHSGVTGVRFIAVRSHHSLDFAISDFHPSSVVIRS